ncbi:MAG: phosphoribosylanthranilate isomerase [Marinicellaceae bacterium]
MKNRYFTKFCGITNIEDALNAQKLGCNALGFVFVKKSKRFVNVKQAQEILNNLNPNILSVALFADNSRDEIQEVLQKCAFHVIQFHGSESKQFCSQWQRPYWKAIPMADGVNPLDYAKQYDNAQAYLIDNFGQNKSGGSGVTIDWNKLPQDIDNKWILAGGLNPENIQEATKASNILSFDVSSGIENKPGIKSKHKMRDFLNNLNKP